MFGELVPIGGGDTIPLLKKSLTVGRRESCDICLRFGNVSGTHCQLSVDQGYWFVQDLNSQNGVKVNGVRVARKRLDPDCELIIAKHCYKVVYNPADLGANGPPPGDDEALIEAENAWNDNQARRARELLESTMPEHTGGVDLRGWEWHYLWRLSHSEVRSRDRSSVKVPNEMGLEASNSG